MQRYDFYLSCARVWREKLCKAREKSINLFICFSEPQPILCKSDDLMDVFNSCWVFGRENAAFTNQCGASTNQIGERGWMILTLHRHYGQVGGRTAKWMLAFTKLACMIWGISLLSQRIIGEIIAERRLKTLKCCNYKNNLSILTFV